MGLKQKLPTYSGVRSVGSLSWQVLESTQRLDCSTKVIDFQKNFIYNESSPKGST